MVNVLERLYNISSLILSISEMSSVLDDNISKHNYRVAFISYLLAKYIKPDDRDFIRKTLFAGIFHDIGVLAMRNANKAAKVLFENSQDEENDKKIIKCHCEIGYKILQDSIFKEEAEIVKYHHDPYTPDGEGKIPLEAFIIRFADRIDVLVRKYTNSDLKREYPLIENKLKDIINNKNDFHPTVVKTFFKHISPKEAFWFYLADEEVIENMLAELVRKYSYSVDYDVFFNLAQLLAHIVDFKSPFTVSHSFGVARVARELSRLLEFSEVGQKRMELAGLLHDIGKIRIPIDILEKPGKLTEEEFNLMKSHVFYTYETLRKLNIEMEIIEWASYHHETLDGTGYPLKLKEKDIPLGSRIMAIADIFTALREKRPYREQMPLGKVLEILNENAKRKKIDKKVYQILADNVESIDEVRQKAQSEAERLYRKLFSELE